MADALLDFPVGYGTVWCGGRGLANYSILGCEMLARFAIRLITKIDWKKSQIKSEDVAGSADTGVGAATS
ncbi:hypothetical protein EVAR_34075_1 [Eumeta japonica]|uniref:Uncharacterized protein n=1 Tax=Eumeta variegata TaxID=151549 RepID=A0A4C1WKB3_EUMVA|nr:hypothetical protein EVAR_34075_1 [Eumeta japonica]